MDITEQIQSSASIIIDKLNVWYDSFLYSLPNTLAALLVVFLFSFIAKWVKKYALRGLDRFSANRTINALLGTVASVITILFGLFIALNILDLEKTVTSLLAGAGVVGLALGLAFQEPALNMFSGISMSMRDHYNLGDLIRTHDFYGVITKIGLSYSVIRKMDGQEVVIPNKLLIQHPMINYSTGERRVELQCGVHYDSDLAEVKSTAINAVYDTISYNQKRGIEFFYTEFADSSINFTLRFWLQQVDEGTYAVQKSEAIMAIKRAFDSKGINIPFPIRTLEFAAKDANMISKAIEGHVET